MAGWLPESGYQPGEGPSFERYLGDPKQHPERKQLVELGLPVKPLSRRRLPGQLAGARVRAPSARSAYPLPPSGQFDQCVLGASLGPYPATSPVASTAASCWKVSLSLGSSSFTRSGC